MVDFADTMPLENYTLFPAVSDIDYAVAKKLFSEYARSLGFDLGFQDFQSELENISVQYGHPDGGIILLKVNGNFTGCVGIRKFVEETAELKRMYIQPGSRGHGYGQLLLEQAIELAKKLKYKKILLDTLSHMEAAMKLYREAGFAETKPYRYNPFGNAKYFELTLPDNQGV